MPFGNDSGFQKSGHRIRSKYGNGHASLFQESELTGILAKYKFVEMKICWPVYTIFQFLCAGALAQRQVSGNITGDSEILVSATIRNISHLKMNTSDLGGNYKIAAEIGDSLIFSHVGYISDTVVVNSMMFNERLAIELKIKINYLKNIDVDEMAKYRYDSLRRRVDYDYIFQNKNAKPLWDNKLSGDGRGVNFSPIGHWSSHEKQKRRLKERLIRDDREEFIYYKFSHRVPKLTGLSGDSLITFIYKYKPTYDYCLRATSLDMLVYINDKFILFKKGNYK
ncbi:MAG TPA: hypothetical protein VGZ90_07640 [Puia sp.]|nr:hypothetical protein [Puia sp.]